MPLLITRLKSGVLCLERRCTALPYVLESLGCPHHFPWSIRVSWSCCSFLPVSSAHHAFPRRDHPVHASSTTSLHHVASPPSANQLTSLHVVSCDAYHVLGSVYHCSFILDCWLLISDLLPMLLRWRSSCCRGCCPWNIALEWLVSQPIRRVSRICRNSHEVRVLLFSYFFETARGWQAPRCNGCLTKAVGGNDHLKIARRNSYVYYEVWTLSSTSASCAVLPSICRCLTRILRWRQML